MSILGCCFLFIKCPQPTNHNKLRSILHVFHCVKSHIFVVPLWVQNVSFFFFLLLPFFFPLSLFHGSTIGLCIIYYFSIVPFLHGEHFRYKPSYDLYTKIVLHMRISKGAKGSSMLVIISSPSKNTSWVNENFLKMLLK